MSFIRPALPTDASRIAEIIITNYRENFYPIFKNDEFYYGELNVMGMAAEYSYGSEALKNTFVYDDGVVRGVIRLKEYEVEKLYVEPAFQSRGIGAQLLNFAIKEKKSEFLWVLEYNEKATAFYQRHGFTLTGEKIIEDEWVPLLKMTRNSDVQLRVITQNSSEKTKLEFINTEAFPINERTSIDDLFGFSDSGNLDILGIYTDNELVGFFAIRKYKNIRYMAYFAVSVQKRSKGIGSKALHLLKEFYPNCQIINEFDAPNESCDDNSVRIRRRNFYLRNGFYETGWYNYYDEDEFEITCSDNNFKIDEFKDFIIYLNSIIPDHIPEPYQKHK